MKILLDHCVNWRLRRSLEGHEVYTAQDEGWEDFANGMLLSLAASEGFEVLLTVDRKMQYQQNPRTLPIPVILMIPRTNDLADLVQLVPRIELALVRLDRPCVVKIQAKTTG